MGSEDPYPPLKKSYDAVRANELSEVASESELHDGKNRSVGTTQEASAAELSSLRDVKVMALVK